MRELRPGWVDLWWARLDLPEAHVRRLGEVLSFDERERARCLRFERDRRRFVVARGNLRLILSEYVDQPASGIVFEYGPHGKPGVRGSGLAFNLAHSSERAVYAVSTGAQVGVDLERILPLEDLEQVARAAFSVDEQTRLLALEPQVRLHAFYEAWTRKEAYLKARGVGLGSRGCVFEDTTSWSAVSFTPEEGYVGALVADVPDVRLCLVKSAQEKEPRGD